MSWFDTAGLASFAKTALKEAQKQIDKALDIQDDDETSSTTKNRKHPETSKTEPSTPSYGAKPTASIPTSSTSVWGSFSGSYFEKEHDRSQQTVTTPPSTGTRESSSKDVSDSVDLVTSPSLSSPMQLSTATVLNSESIEVLGAVAEPRSENSSFIVVASSASSTPASEFSDAADHQMPRVEVEDDDQEEDNDNYPEEEDDENTMSESLAVTVMEPRGLNEREDSTPIVTIPPSRQSLHLSLSNTSSAGNLSKSAATTSDMDNSSTGSDQTLINPPDTTASIAVGQKTNAASIALSLESYELQTEFSDSTQSFEEVPRGASADDNGSHAPATNTSSGDEIETTTSSDIEIISNPNGGGDGSSTASRLSPHKDSGVMVVVTTGPGGVSGGVLRGHRGHSRELSAASSQCSDELSETDRLFKRIDELSEQLEKKEYKLLELSKQNAELQERVAGINSSPVVTSTSSIQSSSGVTSSSSSVDAVTEEFTHRLSSLEKRFQHAIRERDQLRDQLKAATGSARIPKDVHEAAIAERDFLIGELKQEGEKLSKQILQHSTILKKLRAKEKETDEVVRRQREELREQGEEMERLKRSCTAKEDVERTQIEAVNQLSSTKIVLEAENGELKGKLDDAQEKLNAVQVSLSATKQELIDQKRLTADLKSRSANLESQCADRREAREKGDQMQQEVHELREKLRQLEAASQNREQMLRKENSDLMRRVEDSELRNEELNEQVALATVPLLKQMEGLQMTLNSRSANWERQERDLVETLSQAEQRLRVLVDIETKAQQMESSLRLEVQSLEQRIATLQLKTEQAAAGAQQKEIELQLRLADVEREGTRKSDAKRELEGRVREMEGKIREKENRVEELEAALLQLKMAKSGGGGGEMEMSASQRFEREEFGTDLECQERHGHGLGVMMNRSSPMLSREHSLDGSLTSNQWPLDDIDTLSNHGRPSLGSFYGAAGGGGGFGGLIGGHTSTLENLQSNLKQRDGEVYHLQWEMNRMQTQRNTLANEISEMTCQMEALSAKCAQHDQAMEQFQELQKKYDAMLQLYGEKVEEAEELKLDLLESKEAYKTQIEGLLANRSGEVGEV